MSVFWKEYMSIILKNQGKQCEGENRMSFMDLLFVHLLALCLPPKFCTGIKYCFQFLLGRLLHEPDRYNEQSSLQVNSSV